MEVRNFCDQIKTGPMRRWSNMILQTITKKVHNRAVQLTLGQTIEVHLQNLPLLASNMQSTWGLGETFSGNEAVEWIAENLHVSRDSAVQIATKMLAYNLMSSPTHVSKEKLIFSPSEYYTISVRFRSFAMMTTLDLPTGRRRNLGHFRISTR